MKTKFKNTRIRNFARWFWRVNSINLSLRIQGLSSLKWFQNFCFICIGIILFDNFMWAFQVSIVFIKSCTTKQISKFIYRQTCTVFLRLILVFPTPSMKLRHTLLTFDSLKISSVEYLLWKIDTQSRKIIFPTVIMFTK